MLPFIIFRNSIGDVQMPNYSFWYLREEGQEDKVFAGMVVYCYWLFVMIQLFMNVLLLNFLIAVISESYTKVLDNEQVIRYKQKSYFNDEASYSV
jgi:hypothetical protein